MKDRNLIIAESSQFDETFAKIEEADTEMNYLLNLVEKSDSNSVGSILGGIYNSGESKSFFRALQRRCDDYDKEIRTTSVQHFDNFSSSVQEVIELQSEYREIRDVCSRIDVDIKTESLRVSRKVEEILRYRRTIKNAFTAIGKMSECIPVLVKYGRLLDLLENRKYYQALRVLESLENSYLPLIERYRFSQGISSSFPLMRQKIKLEAYSEFKDFLESVKKVAGRVGVLANHQCATEENMMKHLGDNLMSRLRESISGSAIIEFSISSDGRIIKRSCATPNRVETEENEAFLSAQDLIDFAPLYRSYQIFTLLDTKAEFDKYYTMQRMEQCRVLVQGFNKVDSFGSQIGYVNEVVGFFVIEDAVLTTNIGLSSNEFKDQLWEIALCSSERNFLAEFMKSDVETMMRMKKLIQLFAFTMQSYGYSVSALYNLLRKFRDAYVGLLLADCCKNFEVELGRDNFAPLLVYEEEYESIVAEMPIFKKERNENAFPKTLPFSRFVVTVYSNAKHYIIASLQFMEDLRLTSLETESVAARCANDLVSKWVEMLEIFLKHCVTLPQLTQTATNVRYLEDCCEHLGEFITKALIRENSPEHHVVLSQKAFRGLVVDIEQRIEEFMCHKVDEFMELADYRWDLSESSGRASVFISDLINFLHASLISFRDMSEQFIKHICMQTCKHLSTRLSELLLSSETKFLSRGALEQFNLDVMQCETFAARCPVSDFDHETLAVAFAHLRQLLDLVICADWTTYLAEYGRQTVKYNRVNPKAGHIVLEKMMEFERRSQVFFIRNRSDTRKLFDTILQQLQSLSLIFAPSPQMPDFFLNVPNGETSHNNRERRSSDGCLSAGEFLSNRMRVKNRGPSHEQQTRPKQLGIVPTLLDFHLLEVLKKNYEIVLALADIERGEESPEARHKLMRGHTPRVGSPRPLVVQQPTPKWRNDESTSVSSNEDITDQHEPVVRAKWKRLKTEAKFFVDDIVDAFESTPNTEQQFFFQNRGKLSAVQLKKDLKRFCTALHPFIEVLAALYDLIMWKNPISTLLLTLVYAYSVFRGWTVILVLLLTLLQLSLNYLSARKNIEIGLMFLPRKEVPLPGFDISGAQLIFEVAKMVQNLVGFAADVLEKLHSLFTWKDEGVTKHFLFLIIYWLFLSIFFDTGTCLGMCALTLGVRIFLTTYLFSRFPKLRYRLDTWGYFYRNLPLKSPNSSVRPHYQQRADSEERSQTPCSTGRRSTVAGETFESRLGSNFNLDQGSAANLLLGHNKVATTHSVPTTELAQEAASVFLDARSRQSSTEEPSRSDFGLPESARSEFSHEEEFHDDSSIDDDPIIDSVIAFRSCVMNEREKIFPKGITSGILYLTDAALIFRPRGPSEQKEPTMMLFHDITTIKKTQSVRSLSLITGTRKSLEVTVDGHRKPLQFVGLAKRDDFVTRVQLMCRNAGATPIFSETN
ncbi:unnamed protein product [Caenorhabditis auriculariae]|uniref:Exocyst complex component 6 n=1 Tax=Caenorhabditis auriculariae TaxID=2777116 RepID=A0A8S1HTD8_9PELO|nr:unnamed protein product [Caenorhabditis auriculariae]